MNITLKTRLNSTKDVNDVLNFINKIKAEKQLKDLNAINNYYKEYDVLYSELLEIGKELNNLSKILKDLNVYCPWYGSYQEYDHIQYSVLGNGKKYFVLTFYWHYMSLQYSIEKEFQFSNIELGAKNNLEVLEYQIKLMKAFISDYPFFIRSIEKEINYKLEKLMEDGRWEELTILTN